MMICVCHCVCERDGNGVKNVFLSLEFSAGRSDVLRRQLPYSCAIIRATRRSKAQIIQGKKRIKKLESRRETICSLPSKLTQKKTCIERESLSIYLSNLI